MLKWMQSVTALLLALMASPSWAAASSGSESESFDNAYEATVVTAELHLLGFDEWLDWHNKSYENDFPGEFRKRHGIFKANAGIVQRHNEAFLRGDTNYAMTLKSPFADMTADEFADQYLMESQNCSATHTSSGKLEYNLEDLPSFVDWRTRGIITPIKNQKSCGSCWTFSTTGTLEAHTCLHGGQPDGVDCTEWTGLAEQQLLDCALAYDNHGCNGGLPSHAFEYIREAGGLDTEASYKYRADDGGPCAASPSSWGAHVTEVYNVTAYDEDDLVAAIAQVGPVSIAYQVSPDFRLYSHGVYDSWNATTSQTMCKSGPMDVNHAVVAVGYGETEAGKDDSSPPVPFYIVRNSWSTSWGMEGYFWMERNKNLCGVSDCASFPIVPSSKMKKESPTSLRNAKPQEELVYVTE